MEISGFDVDSQNKLATTGSAYDLRERLHAVFPCDVVSESQSQELISLAMESCVTSDDDTDDDKLYRPDSCTFDITKYEPTDAAITRMAKRRDTFYKPFNEYECDVVKEQSRPIINNYRNFSMDGIFANDIKELAFKARVMCLHDAVINFIREFIADQIAYLMLDIGTRKGLVATDTTTVLTTSDVADELRHSASFGPVTVYGYGIQGVRYLYNSAIFSLVNGGGYRLCFTVKALMVMNDILLNFMLSVIDIARSTSTGLITSKDIENAICYKYSWERIAGMVVEEVEKFHLHYFHEDFDGNKEISVEDYFQENNEIEVPAIRFSCNKNNILLSNRYPGLQLSIHAIVAVTAAQQEIFSDLIDIISENTDRNRLGDFNECSIQDTYVVVPRDVLQALQSEEIADYFQDAVIRDGGYPDPKIENIGIEIKRIYGEEDSTFAALFNAQFDESNAYRIVNPCDGHFYWNDTVDNQSEFMRSMLLNFCSRYALAY